MLSCPQSVVKCLKVIAVLQPNKDEKKVFRGKLRNAPLYLSWLEWCVGVWLFVRYLVHLKLDYIIKCEVGHLMTHSC